VQERLPPPECPSEIQIPTIISAEGREAFGIGSGVVKFRLGTMKDIRNRRVRCPFCSLVYRAARDQIEKDTFEMENYVFASWEIDGREIKQDDQGKSSQGRARTRRIRLHWSGGGYQDTYIVLLAESSTTDSLFLGRYIESSRSNLALVNKWVAHCEHHHGPPCNFKPEFEDIRTQPYFGVIDVKSMSLTRLPENAVYAALSYTWGFGERFTTQRANVRTLQEPEGVKKILTQIPRAIRDAINLVDSLGLRYLWVDSLCIVQDSSNSWKLNARVMDRVYGNAFLTICAADDPDGSAGLVGLDPSQRRFRQHIETCTPGVRLMVAHVSETYIRNSNWNKRAWTFQERLLSRRCLLFTKGRVYFQCRSSAMSEDIVTERKGAGWSIELVNSPLQILSALDGRAVQVYIKTVELYTSRQLTRPEDILSAFSGISNLVERALRAEFIYGLPNTHFDWALLWEPQGPAKRRDFVDFRSTGAPEEFPSWSWCGWMGAMEYRSSTMSSTLLNIHEWLMQHTWIIWYIRDGQGNLRLVYDARNREENCPGKESRWKGYEHSSGVDCELLDPYGRRPRWADRCGTLFKRTLPEFPFGVCQADPGAERDLLRSDMRFLQFWTWSAHFYLTVAQPSGTSVLNPSLRRYDVTDRHGDWCGTMVISLELSNSLNLRVPHEMIATSDAMRFSSKEYDGWTYYTSTERDQSVWDLYFVFLVQHDSLGIGQRIGLGKVYKEAFQNSCAPGAAWKEFILG
jgi:hypothetical protein